MLYDIFELEIICSFEKYLPVTFEKFFSHKGTIPLCFKKIIKSIGLVVWEFIAAEKDGILSKVISIDLQYI